MTIKVQKYSYEQFTRYSFLEKDLRTLNQLREAIIKIFRGQTNIGDWLIVGNNLIVISPIYLPLDSDLWRFNLDDYTNLISFYTLRKAIIKVDNRIKLY